MNLRKIMCPGTESQTALAARDKYSAELEIVDCGEIEAIPSLIEAETLPFVVPIWNSNLGEVSKSKYVWNYLVEENLFIHDLWAKEIEFWHVKLKNSDANFNKLGVVSNVANTQCKSYKDKLGIEFIGYPLSSIALQAYRAGHDLDGVLIAPYDHSKLNLDLDIVEMNTVEPYNFTSFATIQHIKHINTVTHLENSNYLTAVEIKPLTHSVGEVVIDFFDRLINDSQHLNDIPKLLFVFNRDSKAGLLFQSSTKLTQEDFFDMETIEKNEIGFHSEAGRIDQKYDHQLASLLTTKFPNLVNEDFVLHRGIKSYLFVCKTFGIYTHGYEEDLIDPVFRYYVHRIFDAMHNGMQATQEQTVFFERLKSSWLAKGQDFITFDIVSSAAN